MAGCAGVGVEKRVGVWNDVLLLGGVRLCVSGDCANCGVMRTRVLRVLRRENWGCRGTRG